MSVGASRVGARVPLLLLSPLVEQLEGMTVVPVVVVSGPTGGGSDGGSGGSGGER